MSEAPNVVVELIDRFRRNLSDLRLSSYLEAHLRQEFLNPLFKSLGWDINNELGRSERFKEVVHEDSIEVEGRSKAPDYGFRIGGNRIFFVEGKKPAVNIDRDPSGAYQLRRYCWSAEIPLGILTNFEHFAIYDCRLKPRLSDRAAKARIAYFSFLDLSKEWNFLEGVFSRDAVLRGDFDRFAESATTKRGTEEVGNSLLSDIETWRLGLARNIAIRNHKLTQPQLNFAVQSLIDRIIFLRICEDRKLEPYRQLAEAATRSNVYENLCDLFRRADYKYNSGLFHFEREKDRVEPPDELSLALAIDDHILKDIVSGLYYPDSPYEFSVFPPEILGQVYEQFLSKIIRLTLGHQAKVEDKPEVRKAGGVYYTPTFVVKHIVNHTIGPLLENKNPRQAKRIKIVDPTCGSGSFLLGAYSFLLDWHRQWYEQQEPARYKRQMYLSNNGEWRLTVAERRDILLHSIFGVDLDIQAVEVTKLSLLLAVLEHESDESLNKQQALFHADRVLPDLGRNIRSGNSIIGSDFAMQGDLFGELETIGEVNPFDWEAEFPDVFTGRDQGFHAVIGNPPWGAEFDEHQLEYLRTAHTRIIERMIDSYIYFLDKACQIASPRGFIGFIVPGTVLNQADARAVRRVYLDRGLVQVINLGRGIFGKSVLNTSAIVISGPFGAGEKIRLQDLSEQSLIDKMAALKSTKSRALSFDTWKRLVEQDTHNTYFVGNLTLPALLLRLRKKFPSLRDVLAGEIQRGVTPDVAEAHVLDHKTAKRLGLERELLKPSVSGGQIKRFTPWKADRVLIYTTRDTELNKYPNVRSYMSQFRSSITCREVLEKKHPWWALHRPRNPEIFDAPKLVGLTTVTSVELIYDENKSLYVTDAMYVFKPAPDVDPIVLMAVMQSSTFGALYSISNQGEGRVIPQVKAAKLHDIPVPASIIDSSKKRELNSLVRQIAVLNGLAIRERVAGKVESYTRQAESLVRRLDAIVDQMYGLSSVDQARLAEYLAGRA
jgi:hypothetical protein